MPQDIPGLTHCCRLQPTPEMQDYNGHVAAVQYVALFERGFAALLARLGLARFAEGRVRLASVEAHFDYRSEVFAGNDLSIETRVLGVAGRHVHAVLVMFNRSRDALAAMSEFLFECRDTATGAPAALTPAELEALAVLAGDRNPLPEFINLGRRIGIVRRQASPA